MSDISSLGIGSGVLTSDVIDQLKAADTSRIIKPIENKITINNQQQTAQELLTSLMRTFKASASALSYDTIFDNKTVDISGKALVTVDAGATAESFTLETVALAQKNIQKLGAVADKAAAVASGAFTGTEALNISIGAQSFDIAYDATTSLEDLAQAITDQAGGSVTATILQTGTNAFNLIITSKETGAAQAMTISDSGGLLDPALFAAYDPVLNPDGMQEVQLAQDATFKYNGITATRSTNVISDLVLGVNITLKETGDISNVNIAQDTSTVTDEMQLFVDSYNALITNISDMLAKDKETGAEGIFNGNSFIRNIARDLTSTITALDGNNNSLVNYGIDLDRSGTMSFNKSVLEKKMADDPDAVKLYFSGGLDSKGATVTGFFETLNNKINDYTGYGGLLTDFAADLDKQSESLSENYKRAQESLDARYGIMTQRFIAFDGMISRINSQFSSLQMMIASELNSK